MKFYRKYIALLLNESHIPIFCCLGKGLKPYLSMLRPVHSWRLELTPTTLDRRLVKWMVDKNDLVKWSSGQVAWSRCFLGFCLGNLLGKLVSNSDECQYPQLSVFFGYIRTSQFWNAAKSVESSVRINKALLGSTKNIGILILRQPLKTPSSS